MANCYLSDAELWDLIVNDDHHAFTIMFQRHWLRLYKTSSIMLRTQRLEKRLCKTFF